MLRQQKQNVQEKTIYKPYIKSLLTTKIPLLITEIGKNIKQNLEKKISSRVENKCIVEGFIKPNTVKVISYSSGVISSEFIDFHVIYECMVAHPVESMLIEATVKTLTKAGIHAQVIDENGTVPITVFVARDHHHHSSHFNNVKENDNIIVKVIGQRFELNDTYICVIATLENQQDMKTNVKKNKPKLVVFGNENT